MNENKYESIGERIKAIRDLSKLTQVEFGQKISVSQSMITLYETNKHPVPERVRKSICREFNVDYLWLTTGEGEMFSDSETIFDKLAKKFDLDESEKRLIESFVMIPKNKRKIVMDLFQHT